MESSSRDIAVSIILPAYNAEQHVEICVKSILAQTFGKSELIIVDDGSSDSTNSIVQSFAKRDPRVRVITQDHAGVAVAMNTGMREAKGKYMARIDADDEMFPARIGKQFHFLESNPEIGVVSSLVKHGGHPEEQEGYGAHISWINSLLTNEQILLNRFIDSPVCNPSVMFRKELVEKYGGCRDGNFPEDYDMWLRWMENGVRFEKIPEILTTWNDPLTRLTRNHGNYSAEAFSRIKAVYLSHFIDKKNSGRKLWLCGAGRITRKKSDFLVEHGISINGYIDVDPKKIGKEFGGLPVIGVNDIGGHENNFIVSYVGNRGARDEIRKILVEK
ncbi:MAG TPA: glycosyltransferase, partial [Bacteroidia bacterium]|nr:glycosyltransferase [Bacteroidia bacterium]